MNYSRNFFKKIKEKIKNFELKKITYFINFEKYKNFKNLRKLAKILSFTSIINNIFFYIWLFLYINSKNNSQIISLLTISIILNFYTAYLFLVWGSPYENTKWNLWGWISMIFVSPFGWVMLWLSFNDFYWQYDPETIYNKNFSIFHSFTNSFSNLPKTLENSVEYIKKTCPDEFQIALTEYLNISDGNCQNWNNKTKHFIIALKLALQSNKKAINDIVLNPHWYDERNFDFAIKDKKAEITVVKYIYLIAFIVIDEFNNYQKILNMKKEIKRNLRFSPAKVICLHWGKGYKIYVNG